MPSHVIHFKRNYLRMTLDESLIQLLLLPSLFRLTKSHNIVLNLLTKKQVEFRIPQILSRNRNLASIQGLSEIFLFPWHYSL